MLSVGGVGFTERVLPMYTVSDAVAMTLTLVFTGTKSGSTEPSSSATCAQGTANWSAAACSVCTEGCVLVAVAVMSVGLPHRLALI